MSEGFDEKKLWTCFGTFFEHDFVPSSALQGSGCERESAKRKQKDCETAERQLRDS